MKHNRNPLATAIHYALGAGAMAGLAMTAAPVVAQEDEEAAELDRVEVTGTRLARIDFEGASPVTVISRADIERSGFTDVGEVLRQLPAVTGGPLGTSTNNGGNGGSFTNLRGMGVARTLVLIDGRRQGGAADFSLIPTAAIERIEVLKEGASAVYGADAVAGVVNIITRREFQGAQVSLHYGASFETAANPARAQRDEWAGSNGDIARASFVLGDVGERGSFVLGAERSKQDPVYEGNLKNTFNRVVLDPAPGQFDAFIRDGHPRCLETGSCVTTGGSSSNLQGFFVPRSGGAFVRDLDTGAIRPFSSATDLYNYAPVNFIQQPFTRTSVFAQGEYDLFENVNAYISSIWANRRSEQELAPTPLFVGIFDPGFTLEDGLQGVSADNVFNPFGEDVIDVRRRVAEGRRRFEQDVVQTSITVGLRGDFSHFAPTWTWDTHVTWGRQLRADTDFGQFVGARFAEQLGPSFFDEAGNAVCGTPDNPILDCVPMDLFGGFGTITDEMLNHASVELNDRITSTLLVIGGGVQGDVVDLPAGPLGLAIGYEYREPRLESIPDSGKATDTVSGNTFGKTVGKFDVNSVFAEVNVPILGNLPGAEILEIGAGVRRDSFSTVGDNTSFMLTGRWKPFHDLLIRGSYSEVFREPTIGNLFSPQGDSFPSFVDPCSNSNISDPEDNQFAGLTPEQQARCIATGVPAGGFFQTNMQPRARVGGNPDLDPESGETITAGFAYSPSQVPGLTLTVDYWDIDLKDPISAVGAQSIMEQCILVGNLDFCDNIVRQGPGTASPGEVDRIVSLALNAGGQKAQGWDFELAYNRATDLGVFNFRTLWTYLDSREGFILEADRIDVAGHFLDSSRQGLTEAVYPKWSGLSSVDWSLGDFGASISHEWLDSVTDILNGQNVPTVQYVDITGRYHTPWGSRFAVGLTNVFNTAVPFIFNGFNGATDADTYRMLGRSWFVNLTHEF